MACTHHRRDALAWSQDKAQLLVLDKDGAAVYPAAGGILMRAAEKSAQAWLPGGLLLPAGWVANAQGATAHIEVKDGLSTVKMRPPAPSSAETGWLLKSKLLPTACSACWPGCRTATCCWGRRILPYMLR